LWNDKYGAEKITAEFSRKNWSTASVNRLLHSGVLAKASYYCRIRDVNHLKERLLEE